MGVWLCQPRQSPLYRTIERYFPEFERIYDARYAKRYGPWRPIIGDVVRKFLRCGDLHFGFARVRCSDCRHEMFVAFSCQQRCFCPSCHQKRTLLTAETIAQTICVPVCVLFPPRLKPKGGDPVVCLSAKVAAVYRPRRPRQSPLYRTIERYYPEFERTYDERYAKRYGPPMLQTMEFLIDQDSILIHEE